MNIGYAVAGLGILGIIVGIGFYAAGWHKTIGLGGVALGIVLLVIGVWFAMTQKKPAPPASQPQQ